MIEDKVDEGCLVNDGKSILKRVHIGDFVELFVDAAFFGSACEYERYGGFVTSIDNYIIGLSASHPNNKYHGYDAKSEKCTEMKTTQMCLSRIKKYKVLQNDNWYFSTIMIRNYALLVKVWKRVWKIWCGV